METRQGKLAPSIARTIEAEIMERGWPVGEYLGSESSLIERFGVSRAVIREAVRIVESHGAATMRLGPGGGLRVTAPTHEVLVDPVGLVLNHAEVSARQLFEARCLVELECVRLATERIGEAGIARLRTVLALDREPEAAEGETAHSQALHHAIAEESGNPAMSLLVKILAGVMREGAIGPAQGSSAADAIHSAHAAIVAAIVAGDVELAQHRMQRHLAAVISEHYRPEALAD